MQTDRLTENVGGIMTTKVISISPEEHITAVAEQISNRHIHGLPVIDEGSVVGMITEQDFFVGEQSYLHVPSFMKIIQKALIPRTLSSEDEAAVRGMLNLKARDIMASPCVTIGVDTTIDSAVELCVGKHIETLPVVGMDGKLVGIVTLTDLISYLYQKE